MATVTEFVETVPSAPPDGVYNFNITNTIINMEESFQLTNNDGRRETNHDVAGGCGSEHDAYDVTTEILVAPPDGAINIYLKKIAINYKNIKSTLTDIGGRASE
jgi:hypothetical protein